MKVKGITISFDLNIPSNFVTDHTIRVTTKNDVTTSLSMLRKKVSTVLGIGKSLVIIDTWGKISLLVRKLMFHRTNSEEIHTCFRLAVFDFSVLSLIL